MAKKKLGSPKAEPVPVSADVKREGEKDYEAEDAAHQLLRSAEIQENPELHARALKHLKKKKKAINSIASLKARRQELIDAEDDDDGDDD